MSRNSTGGGVNGFHIVAAILWPVPPIWFLRRAHDNAAEIVCDSIAAELVGGKALYAATLARQSLHALGYPRLATVPMLRRSGIRQRIDLLLSGFTLPAFSRGSMMITGMLALFFCGILSGVRVAVAGDVLPGMGSESTKGHTAVTSTPVGEPVLDLNVDGTACSGTIRVPLGMTIMLAVRDSDRGADIIPLYQTLLSKGPVGEVPYVFRFQYAKDDAHGKVFLTQSGAWGIAYPIKVYNHGGSGGGSSHFPAPETPR